MNRALRTNKPPKMWIDGKCFIMQRFNKWDNGCRFSDTESTNSSIYDYGTNNEGQLFTSFRLPSSYNARILKFPHFDLKQLETNTNTTIKIPNEGNVVIVGENEEKIAQARDKIHSVLVELRDSGKALQFISVPTLTDEIKQNFNRFKTEILNGDPIIGMEESIFQSPHKLHLTVVVFALLDDNEISEAVNALQDYKNTILEPLIKKTGPIKIRVSGINCMNDNLKKVHILYAMPQIVDEKQELSLQKLVNDLSDHFYDRGLVRTYQDNVKLHITLINTKYRKVTKRKRWPQKISFDATTIMEKYKDFYFGECDLNCIHLSLISSVGDDGFYKPISTITL